MLLTSHWFGCIFYYIAYLQGLDSSNSWTEGTKFEDPRISMSEKYTTSLYWAVYTITLVGYGDIKIKSNAEMLFSIMCMISGAVLCDAGITAILSSLVHAMDASAGESHAWTQVITRYMKHAKMPEDLQEQIYGYFVYIHLNEDDLEEEKVLSNMPRMVRHKLLEEICYSSMRKMPSLNSFADGFIRSIVYGMVPYLSLPKEILIVENEPSPKLFLIVKGKVHVLSRTKQGGEVGGGEGREGGASGADVTDVTGTTNKIEDRQQLPTFSIEATITDGGIIGDFKPNRYTYRTSEYSDMYTLDLTHYSDCFSFVNNNKNASKRNLVKGEGSVRSGYLVQEEKDEAKSTMGKLVGNIAKSAREVRRRSAGSFRGGNKSKIVGIN